MPRRLAALIATITVALLAAGALAAPPRPAQSQLDVSINDLGFTQPSGPVSAGDSIRWTNSGSTAHTTTSDTGIWDSSSLSVGASFIQTFSQAGSFPYHCTIHPNMTGTIVVQGPTTPTSTSTTTATPTRTRTATVTSSVTRTPTRTATVTATPLGRNGYFPIIQVPIPPTPTNTATATPPPAGVVSNGDFEEGHVAWVELTDEPYAIIRTTFPGSFLPHSGIWAAWLGGVYGVPGDDASTAITQRLTIAPDRPYLSYWHWIASEDGCGNFDVAGVGVDYGAADVAVADTLDLCVESSTGGWRQRTVDMRKYAGQTVTVIFVTVTDNTRNSNWFIDDVAFQSTQATVAEPVAPAEDTGAAQPHSGSASLTQPAQQPELSDLVRRLRERLLRRH